MTKNKYSKAELKQEEEANIFACLLLMPTKFWEPEIEKRRNMIEEQKVKELASVFDVPEWAVVLRFQIHHKQINNL